MTLSKTRALSCFTCLGAFAVLAACSVSACNKSDQTADDTAGGTAGGGAANGGMSNGSGGKAGQAAGAGGSGVAGSGVAGSEAGAPGAAGDGAAGEPSAGNGGSDQGGTGGATGGSAGNGGSGGATCAANLQTDPNNCGHCGRVCESGECSSGLCAARLVLDSQFNLNSSTELYTHLSHAELVDQAKIYMWLYGYEGAGDVSYNLLSAPTGTVSNPPSQGKPLLEQIANTNAITATTFDATTVYQAVQETGQVLAKKLSDATAANAGSVAFKLPLATPPARAIWTNIAVSGNSFFLTEVTSTAGANNSGDVTTFYSITAPTATATVAKMTTLTGAGRATQVTDLTVASGHLFWLETASGDATAALFTAPVAGTSAPVMVAPDVGSDDHASIASDGTNVYWSIANSLGEVDSCPLANLTSANDATTHTKQLAPLDDSSQEGLFVDAQYVYVAAAADADGTPVYRIKKTGGDKERLSSFPSPTGLVVGIDANFVYLQDGDGKIWRVPNTP